MKIIMQLLGALTNDDAKAAQDRIKRYKDILVQRLVLITLITLVKKKTD